MADEKVRYVLDVDDKGSPKLIKFGDNAKSAGKKAEKGFADAGKAVSDFGDQIPGVSGAMQKMAAGPAVMAGAAVAALGIGFASMVKKSIDFADNMNDLSLRLGISTERLSVLSLYAEQSGTDIDTLATAMGKLGVKISEGDKDLKRWGITAGTSDEALFQLADRIAATEDPMLRLKIATDAFGKSGQNMLPLLVQGGDALKLMADSAPTVTAEMAKMSDQFNDISAEASGKFRAIGMEIAIDLLPHLIKAVELAKEFADSFAGGQKKAESGAKNWTDEAARIQGEMNDPSISAWRKRVLQSELNNAKLMAGNFQKQANELAIGAMSGPGGMGGYRGEDVKAAEKAKAAKVSFGAAAAPIVARAETGRATEVDFQQIEEEWQKQHGGLMGVSVDAEKALGPDYYSNIPVSPKAMEHLEAQRKKADAIADASVAKQREQIASIAQGASGVLSNSFMQAGDGVNAVFQSIADGFANMIAQMVAELAANAAILAILNIVAPGSGAVMSGGLGGLSGLVLGRATGGPLPGSGAVVYNERREEAIIQRGPARVEPTSGTGNTYVFQVQNPAQAATLQRSIEREKRQGRRGIR